MSREEKEHKGSTGRKVVFGVIFLLFTVEILAMVAGHAGEPIRPDLLLAQLLVLFLPIRSTRPDGTRLYSAMVYRVISAPAAGGRRERKMQLYPKNFASWEG